jgi:hypothetical protein
VVTIRAFPNAPASLQTTLDTDVAEQNENLSWEALSQKFSCDVVELYKQNASGRIVVAFSRQDDSTTPDIPTDGTQFLELYLFRSGRLDAFALELFESESSIWKTFAPVIVLFFQKLTFSRGDFQSCPRRVSIVKTAQRTCSSSSSSSRYASHGHCDLSVINMFPSLVCPGQFICSR